MKNQLNQLIANIGGNFIELSDRNNVYQCLDLVYLWCFVLGVPKSAIQRLYAYQVFTSPNDETKKHFDLIPNTPEFVPVAGDIAVWKYGVAGHIAVCTGNGDTNLFEVWEQNNPIGSYPIVRFRNYTDVIGFLRPKAKDTLEVLKTDFERLVKNSSRYDDFVKLGYSTKEDIEKLINSLKLAQSNTKDIIENSEKLLIEEKANSEKALIDLRTRLEIDYTSKLLTTERTWQEVLDISENKLRDQQRELDSAKEQVRTLMGSITEMSWNQIIQVVINKLKNE